MLAPNAYSWDLSDPGEDKIMGWDNSASATDKMSWFGVSQGLVFSGTNIVPTYGTTASTVAEGNHTHSGVYDPAGTAAGVISDAVFGAGWDGVTGISPSKNALYDYLSLLALSTHDHAGVYEPANTSLLKSSNIGSTVQGQLVAASQAEMEEGTVAALRVMTPERVKQAITAQAGTGSGDLKSDGTVPLSADWNAVKAITAESYTSTKVSGVAGDMGLYEANSTDVDTGGFRGPASMTSNTSYRLVLPTAAPTSDNMTVTFSGTASTGSGTPSNPYAHTGTYTDLDSKVSTSAVPWQRDIHVPAPAATDVIRIRTTKAITLSAIGCIVDPADSSESVVVDLQECNGDGDSCSTVLSGTITCANTNTTGTVSDTAIAANVWILIDLGTVTGTVSDLSIYIRGTEAQ